MLVADDLRLINQLEFVLSTLGVIVVLWLFLEKITEKDKERRNKEVAFVGDVKGYLDKKDKRQQ